MVNTEDFGRRLQKLMEYYSISAAGFADAMGVGRSSISHILSGRNKPSLDFVMKITDAYPEVELYWLLYGKGTFPNAETEAAKTKPQNPLPYNIPKQEEENEKDLFSQTEINNIPIDIVPENKNINNTTPPETKLASDKKQIQQIVIFYNDGTFDSYKN